MHIKYKSIRGTKIAYRQVGLGKKTIICIPSFPMPASEFIPLTRILQEKYKFVLIDMPFWGGNSEDLKKIPTISEYSLVIKEFVKSLKIKDYYLLGYSYGGMIAITDLKELKPKGLILVSPVNSGVRIYKRYKNLLALYKIFKPWETLIKKFMLTRIRRIISNSQDIYAFDNQEEINEFINELNNLKTKKAIETLIVNKNYYALKDIPKIKRILLIKSDSEPKYINKEISEISKYFKIRPKVVKNSDHNHLAFLPNESAKLISAFC